MVAHPYPHANSRLHVLTHTLNYVFFLVLNNQLQSFTMVYDYIEKKFIKENIVIDGIQN